MPDLTSPIHTDMLREYKQQRRPSLPRRLWRAVQHELRTKDYYGQQWGDPDGVAALSFINRRWVQPYVQSDKTGLEIGPGGGRWTRYLLGFETLYVVDHYPELLAELRKTCAQPNMVFVLNDGTDFPSVPDAAVDYLFSFGVFVHLDVPLIESYLSNMKRVLKHGGNGVIQYSDMTKIMARETKSFSQNDPETMRKLVAAAGFRTEEEDLTTLSQSSIIRFTH
jgi:ubiquinone/menaquinone biosynthesis C-methylase UbiE